MGKEVSNKSVLLSKAVRNQLTEEEQAEFKRLLQCEGYKSKYHKLKKIVNRKSYFKIFSDKNSVVQQYEETPIKRSAKPEEEQISKKIISIPRSKISAAAGSPDDFNIDISILEEDEENRLPQGTVIIFESIQEDNFILRMEGDVPIFSTIIFYKNNLELYRTIVSQEIPTVNQWIPIKKIEGWTKIDLIWES